jgi:DNA-binding transcriptional MerR regulator
VFLWWLQIPGELGGSHLTLERIPEFKISGMSEKQFYRSGELARLFGISPDTLRHYERMGLIQRPRRSANRYREYPKQAIDRITLIRSALSVGFTIRELSRILRARDGGKIPCLEVRDLAKKKLAGVEERLKELHETRAILQQLLIDWDKQLKRAPAGERAGLLESLARSRTVTKRKGESI